MPRAVPSRWNLCENTLRSLRSILVLFLVGSTVHSTSAAVDLEPPAVRDSRLRIQLFAREPAIVTPVGIAVDARHRVFVIESHTHLPAKDYPGPKDDRIKLFLDADGDGKPERITVFADGFKDAMNLAISPGGEVYVCHRTGVVVLHDRDGDGRSEARTEIVRLETAQTYSHSCLLGIAFAADGWLYVSRGNLGGYPYTLEGSDGTQVTGYGDGGNIVKCRPDGSRLQLVATGFWNPFGLDFDAAGRLLCVDNDPDSRGPNRLLHIVAGGDYGFKTLYGGSGLHPYDAWDGELPGTLPMLAATGEAPSGVLDADKAALPADYAGNILATIWGTHRIARFRPRPAGASLRAREEVLVEGSRLFRPVGIAAGPDGTIYVTDWVKKDYPNHGLGRIWRLSARPGVPTTRPRDPWAPPIATAAALRLSRLSSAETLDRYDELIRSLTEDDPFLRSAAISALARPVFQVQRLFDDLGHADPQIRLGILLALRRAKQASPLPIVKRLLADPDEDVRKMALIWAGESMLLPLAAEIDQAVSTPGVSPELFRVYLATAQLLTQEEANTLRRKVPGHQIKRAPHTPTVNAVLRDRSKSSRVRAVALTFVDQPDRKDTFALLTEFVRGADPLLQLEAVRTLAGSTTARAAELLETVALDARRQAELRAEAILGLAAQPPAARQAVLPLLDDPDATVAFEAVRTLGTAADDQAVRTALEQKYQATRGRPGSEALAEQLRFALFPPGQAPAPAQPSEPRPATEEEWLKLLGEGGDRSAGRRVFYHPSVTCAKCHAIAGRGGWTGPDLSQIGRSLDRKQLLRAILRPSEDIAQEFQGYKVMTEAGKIYTGTQFHFRGNAVTLILLDGQEVRIPLKDIESYTVSAESLMPENLDRQMSVRDFRNLVAYLLSLK
jgi:putative membrane-bound dehydrogenase-like protein